MAFRYPERDHMSLFPSSIEDYIPEDAPVRAYDAVVDMMDLEELGIDTDEDQVGNSRYDPRTMLKLLVYGYSYGIRSSRKMERALHHNLSFIWLMGGLQPDHKTISEFRRNNKKALRQTLKQVARMCIQLKLIKGNTLFIDGTKIRANASIKQTWNAERCEKALKKIDKRIEEILAECEKTDRAEEGLESEVHLDKELTGAQNLRSKVEEIWKELKESGKEKINSTDRDARQMRGRQGIHASHNAQIAVDGKEGLIVSSDVVDQSSDRGQLSGQVDNAEETLKKPPEEACGDAGYSDMDDLEKISPDIKLIVPSQRQVVEKKPGPFDRENFHYDKERNCYICPEGNELYPIHGTNEKGHKRYRMKVSMTCKQCRHYGKGTGKCTHAKQGRQISRLRNEELRDHLESVYEEEESQKTYKRRKEKVEHPFGHIKHNLQVNSFLLRGFDGVKGELSVLCSCFNIRRMITLLGGVPELISAVKGLSNKKQLYRTA